MRLFFFTLRYDWYFMLRLFEFMHWKKCYMKFVYLRPWTLNNILFPRNLNKLGIKYQSHPKGPSTLATLFNHMWPRIVASTLGRHVCYVCKRSVCGGDEPQPVAHLSHKLQCARQSLKIMVSYGNKYPRHNARPHVAEQSGQCARALRVNSHERQQTLQGLASK